MNIKLLFSIGSPFYGLLPVLEDGCKRVRNVLPDLFRWMLCLSIVLNSYSFLKSFVLSFWSNSSFEDYTDK